MNYIGLIVALLVFVKFFNDLGKVISIRNVFSVLMCLQFVIGPYLVYNGFEDYQAYRMKVSEAEYFRYVTPALICFLLGLYLKPGKKHRRYHEYNDISALKLWYAQNAQVPLVFIGIGFLFTFVKGQVPGEFAFLAYLLSNLKFIGLFLLLLVDKKLRLKWLLLIYGSITVSSFAGGMFHDLFIWSIFFLMIICFKFKFKRPVKLALISVLVTVALFVQSIKMDLRQRIWQQGEEISLEVLEDSYHASTERSGSGFFSKENLAPHITRINQGWIIASLLDNVPRNVDFANGELIYKYLEAALLPRFLSPNKLMSGEKEIFRKYTGHYIGGGTSMGISSVGDAYINYGIYGGWIFMFVYGLLFNLLIRYYISLTPVYPISFVFCLLVLFYTVRPDCELQTTLGHLFKTSLLLFIMYQFFGKHFRVRTTAETA